MINKELRKQMLTDALKQRVEEITEYQVNIDNYTVGMDVIGDDPELQEFKQHLENLKQGACLEQKKSIVIYEAIKKQLG